MTQFEDKLKHEAGSEVEKGEQQANQKLGVDYDQATQNTETQSGQTGQNATQQ